jgi:hypothetical protein
MDLYEGPETPLITALHGGLYLAIIMDHHEGPQTPLNIALHGGLSLAIIMNRHEETKLHLLQPCIDDTI